MADILLTALSHPPRSTIFSSELNQYFHSLFGKTRTVALAKALRRPGSALFLRTNTLRANNEALIRELSKDGVQAYVADAFLNAVAIPIHKAIKVPRHKRVVVADKPSSENVMLGSHLYRPGVLRTDRFKEGDAVTVVNSRGHIVGSGVAAGDSAELLTRHQGLFVQITHPFYPLPSLIDLAAYHSGLFYSQGLSAMLVVPILDPQPHETIIDFCAAPGGKTTHIAQLTQNRSRIIAVDRSVRRLTRLEADAERLGVTCIEIFSGRANEFCEQHPELVADRIIVDPPCTALGVRPKLFDETTMARIRSTASYQRMILDSAVSALRVGGVLVYSTCTLTVEENENNIQYLLASKKFTLESQNPYRGTEGLGEHPLVQRRVQRFYPDLHDLPGYFIAKLRKVTGPS